LTISPALITTQRMENTPALALYDQAVAQFAPTGAHWLTYAALLRAEAARFTGDQARRRIDRAVDCEARARRGAQIEAVREGVRAALAAKADFVTDAQPAVAS
jgi:hypothetical protein